MNKCEKAKRQLVHFDWDSGVTFVAAFAFAVVAIVPCCTIATAAMPSLRQHIVA